MVFKVNVDFFNINTGKIDTLTYQLEEKPTKKWIKELNTPTMKVDGVDSEEI